MDMRGPARRQSSGWLGHFIPGILFLKAPGTFFLKAPGTFFLKVRARRGAAQSHSALGRGGPRRGVFLRLPADPP
jgi:hypothetical protein